MKNTLALRHYLFRLFCGLFALMLMASQLVAQTHLPKYVTINNKGIGYYEYLPDDYDTATSSTYPLIISLHGIGEKGNGTTDLPAVLKNGIPKEIENKTFPKSVTVKGKKYKFIVISPQLNTNAPGWDYAMVTSIFNWVKTNYRVDDKRVYLTGLSMGGGAVWGYSSFMKRLADQLAAIVPVCGNNPSNDEAAAVIAESKLPVWAFHGSADLYVSYNNSTDWVNAINKAAGYQLAKLTLYPGIGHNSWDRAYSATYNQQHGYSKNNIYEWMLEHQRDQVPLALTAQKVKSSVAPPLLPQASAVVSANESVLPYDTKFRLGSNLGYYGTNWNDLSIAGLIKDAGANTIRPSLPEDFLEQYGYGIRATEFKKYGSDLGMQDIVAFVGTPSVAHKEKTQYGPCGGSEVFANLYEPIWNADGSVNTNNYYANYIFKTVQQYGPYVKVWEVWNEPDFAQGDPGQWFNRLPTPCELTNLKAPVFSYVRMLRITWEVVKKYYPNSYVATGGLGYPSFLATILKYSDNPSNGTVSTDYPLKAGAYFDIMSYHFYPMYNLRVWDNSIAGFRYSRFSDRAVDRVIEQKYTFDGYLQNEGYDGKQFPKKHFIITEVNIPRKKFDWYIGSDEAQRNFGIKMVVQAQKNDVKQVHFYTTSDKTNEDAPVDEYSLMGLYQNLRRDPPGSQKMNSLGVALKTTSAMIKDYVYDKASTQALNLPATVDGGVFRKDNQLIYVLWARTSVDESEAANASFTFPAALGIQSMKWYAWDYSVTNKENVLNGQSINLTGSPIFIVASSSVIVVPPDPTTVDEPLNILLYPNPVTAGGTNMGLILNVKISGSETGNGVINIYNSIGQKNNTYTFSKPDKQVTVKTIDMADKTPGLYMVEVILNEKRKVNKVIRI